MAIVRRQLLPALAAFCFLTLLTGVAYPLAVTGIAQVVFPHRADGSLVERNGIVVGSRLVGQRFTGRRWFHPRPSAAGDGYDAMASSASNLGPTNATLLADVRRRAAAYRRENGLPAGAPVPQDAVTS
jgi:K+-transporting ATPase ATPase C chain